MFKIGKSFLTFVGLISIGIGITSSVFLPPSTENHIFTETPSTSYQQVRIPPPVYHLVVGSYGSFDTAKDFIDALQNRGYKPYMIFPEPGGTTYRIGVFSAKDRPAVEQFSRQVQNLNAWIYLEDIPDNWPQNAKTAFYEEDIPAPSQIAGGTMYYLILGSFSTYEAAEELSNRLRENKYEPEILLPTIEAPTYRVYVYSTDDKVEIEAYESKLRRTGRETGWIYEQPADLVAFSRGLSDQGMFSRASAPSDNVLRANFSYYLIAASFKDLASAQQHANQRIDQGYFPIIIAPETPDGYYRVSVYHTNDREELEYYAQQNRVATTRSASDKFWIFEP